MTTLWCDNTFNHCGCTTSVDGLEKWCARTGYCMGMIEDRPSIYGSVLERIRNKLKEEAKNVNNTRLRNNNSVV